MHKLTLMLAVGAVGALTVSAATRTEAAGVGAGADSLRIASDDVSAIQNVLYGRRAYRRAAYGGALYRAPVRRAVAYGSAATAATAAAYSSSSYGYAPGESSDGYAFSVNSHLGDGHGIGIQHPSPGGYSDSAFGFSPTGSLSDGR